MSAPLLESFKEIIACDDRERLEGMLVVAALTAPHLVPAIERQLGMLADNKRQQHRALRIVSAICVALVAGQAHAQNLWDQPQNWTIETPNDHWTATARPMPDGSTQSIFNSDRGRYMLCTSRPMGNGRATISCD